MNFEKIPPVPSSKEILDIAFRSAREKSGRHKEKNKKQRNPIIILRQREQAKLDIVTESIDQRLSSISRSFPDLEALPLFYVKLIRLTTEYVLFKKSLAATQWAAQKVKMFRKEYAQLLTREHSLERIHGRQKEFYGRISSVIKQIQENLAYLEQCRQVMRSYPDIKDMFTVCIYGFPNVGKTTLLNALTGSKAKVAAYAFTTTGINSGFMDMNGMKIQVLDVPGTLARPEKMNPIELQAELVVEEVADLVIYVFDPTEQCGFSLKKQEALWRKLQQEGKKELLVYTSKLDLEPQARNQNHKLPVTPLSLPELRQKIANFAEISENLT